MPWTREVSYVSKRKQNVQGVCFLFLSDMGDGTAFVWGEEVRRQVYVETAGLPVVLGSPVSGALCSRTTRESPEPALSV